jgi:nicotinic acid mononucleotide adenylyltransferase
MSSMLAGRLELLVGKDMFKKKNKWKDWVSLPLLNHGK